MKSLLVKPKVVSRNKVIAPLLQNDLLRILDELGLPTDFTLELRGYSKCLYGQYHVADKKIVAYVLEKDMNTFLPFKDILETVVHEAIHHYQYTNGYRRKVGVMHNPEFMKLESLYFSKLDKYYS